MLFFVRFLKKRETTFFAACFIIKHAVACFSGVLLSSFWEKMQQRVLVFNLVWFVFLFQTPTKQMQKDVRLPLRRFSCRTWSLFNFMLVLLFQTKTKCPNHPLWINQINWSREVFPRKKVNKSAPLFRCLMKKIGAYLL